MANRLGLAVSENASTIQLPIMVSPQQQAADRVNDHHQQCFSAECVLMIIYAQLLKASLASLQGRERCS